MGPTETGSAAGGTEMLPPQALAVNTVPEPPVVSTPGERIVLDHEGRLRGTRVQFDDSREP